MEQPANQQSVTEEHVDQQPVSKRFESVQDYLSLIAAQANGTASGNTGEQGQARDQAHAAAKSEAEFLIHYYFSEIEPDNGERSIPTIGPRPYNTTKTERALLLFNNYRGYPGPTFLEKYPSLLTYAIHHYESAERKKLGMALKQSLSSMTGEQLVLVLLEYNRRSRTE